MVRTKKRTAGAVAGAVTAAMVLTLGGCGGDGYGGDGGSSPKSKPSPSGKGSPSASPSKSPSPTGTAGGGKRKVSLRSAGGLGKVLTGPDGRTLYLFEADTAEKSTCYDACAKAWPPLTVSGKPKAGKGLEPGAVGTTKRKDGSRQVTYNKHPLYYYEGDDKPGDTNGQDLDQFGAEWYVLDASGNSVKESPGQEKQSEEPDQDGGGGY